ncbi:polysaccharide pyruvyl transferase family protein [Gelidibacter salicanalis]|uniref:Polysaccharide pyruvyl transferase family protein n=2 Tax=Gelidibacter salicanalis TaxID=291193 RepID=A0A5C7ABU4_9FLAO|nr:polysaccharide pyruvyl transferase family protein [Gelidibacter salicanalis]
MGKAKENYGDLIGAYLATKISNRKVVWVHPKHWHIKDYFQPIYVTAGSVLAHVNKKCVVWGSGIIQKKQVVKAASFLAVRGPQTRQNLIAQGHEVPEVYGDPAILMPIYYHPTKADKRYRLGIVPHYNDYKQVHEMYHGTADILVIDLMTMDIEATTDLFLQCEHIISSSLHGLIIAHVYQIPAVWVEFSDKLFGDGIKFQDYFESVAMAPYKPNQLQRLFELDVLLQFFDTENSLPKPSAVKKLQEDLMSVCPFK